MNEPTPLLRPLHPTVLTLWRVRGLLFAAPGVLLAAAAITVAAPGPLVGACLVLAVTGVAGGWWWASRRYDRFGYAVTEDVLRVRDGVVVHTDTAVPLFRVQHIDVERGPLERALDLATLVVHTAAPAADTTLPGIASAEASSVRDEILEASREAAARHGIEDVDAV